MFAARSVLYGGFILSDLSYVVSLEENESTYSLIDAVRSGDPYTIPYQLSSAAPRLSVSSSPA
jgi:hypothetical protein